MNADFSVVLPVLNEASRVGQRLRELRCLEAVAEVIVVDGGSHDATVSLVQKQAQKHARIRLLHSARGRAQQMNAGAAAATSATLLFLHADVALPRDAATHIAVAFQDPRVVAGAFRTWTVDDTRSRAAPWLHLADLRSRYSRLPYGDQAIFVRRSVFEAVGGYPKQPLMEDLELSLRLRRHGTIRVVPARVEVSGRRFLRHPVRDTLLVNLFPLLYRLGASPERLKRLYDDIR